MAHRKRPSPTISEIERNIEPNMSNNFPDLDLTDRDTFNKAWDTYFIDKDLIQNSIRTRNETYNTHLFKMGGGKSITQDRQHDAKEKVKTFDEFQRRGSQRVDMEGIDTPPRKHRQFVIIRRKKQIKVFRDKKGRFTSKI